MRVERINRIPFGVRKTEHITKIGNETIHTIEGDINHKHLTIYEDYSNDELTTKIKYLSDEVGNWIETKIEEFKDGKKVKSIVQKKKSGQLLDEIF